MKLIDFQFTKINAEKFELLNKDYKIKSNINLEEIKSILDKKVKYEEDVLEIKFNYELEYSELVKISFKGKILIKLDQKDSKDVLEQWKNKKLPENLKIIIFNLILTKSNVRALQLEDELKIPYHISLPKIGLKKD